MAERVATGEIYIGLHDEEAIANLRRIGQTFDREMDKIDRRKADATIDGDITPLKNALKAAQAELRKYDKERATASVAERRRLDRERSAQNDYVNALRRRIAAQERGATSLKKYNDALDDTSDRLKVIRKQEEEVAKVEQQAEKRRIADMRSRQRVSESLERQRVRELNAAERAAYSMEKERRNVVNLDREYVRLTDKMEKLAVAKKKAGRDERARILVEVEESHVAQRMEQIRGEVWAIAHRNPIEIPVKIDRSYDLGRALREELELAASKRLGSITSFGMSIGRRLGTRVVDGTRDTLDRGLSRVAIDAGRTMAARVGQGLRSAGTRFLNAAEGLADVTLRLGPFTTTIRKAILGLAVLGPTIIDLVGAAGSLVGSLGAATLGVGALGAAVAGGAIPSFLGMGLVIRGVAKQFSAVMTAQKAYDDALRKGNTELAATKMKELRATMGNVSKETAKQFTLMGKLSDSWNKLTRPATAAVFTTMGEGIKTANALLPMFAKNTNQVTEVASKGIDKWLASLREAEKAPGKSPLDEMMDNFRRSLGPVLDGMGSLMGYLGRVGAIASRSLPGLARTFRDWAESVNSVDTASLEDKVEGVIDSAKNMGRFFLEAGRLIKTFFGAGVDAGDSLTETMTNAIKTWREGFETPEGRANLVDFFNDSKDGAIALWHALAPIGSSFLRWARDMAPVAQGFLKLIGYIGDFTHSILSVTALRGPLTALGTTLGVLWSVGKIRTAAEALKGFITGLRGVAAAETAVAVAQTKVTTSQRVGALGAGASMFGAGGAFGPGVYTTVERNAGAIERSAGSVSKLARIGRTTENALAGLSGALIGIPNPMFAVGAAALAAGFGLSELLDDDSVPAWTQDLEDATAATESAIKASGRFEDSLHPLVQAFYDARDARKGVADAQKLVNHLEDKGLQGTRQYRDAVDALNKAIYARDVLDHQTVKTQRQQAAAYVDQVRSARQAKEAAQDVRDTAKDAFVLNEDTHTYEPLLDVYKRAKEGAKEAGISTQQWIQDNLEYFGDGEKDLQAYAKAMDEIATNNKILKDAARDRINMIRDLKGMAPVAKNASEAINYLNKKLGQSKTQNIALKFRGAEDAARVANNAAKALKNGVPKSVTTRIVANADNANEAVKGLNQARLTPKRLEIIEDGGKDAVRMLEQIEARKLTKHEMKIAEEGGDNVLAKLRKIDGTDLPTKKQELETEGDEAVTSTIKDIIQLFLPPKKQRFEKDTSPIVSAIQWLAGIDLTPIIQYIDYKYRGTPPKGKAIGQRAGAGRTEALVGEGSDMKGAKEYIVNSKSGTVSTVSSPVVLPLSVHDAVIPTEPLYRDRGRSIFKDIARDLGLPAFRGGKKGKGKSKGNGAPSPMASAPTFNVIPGSGLQQPGNPGFYPGDPDKNIDRDATFKPGKRKSQTFKINNAWGAYISNLQAQQGYWEREIQIRESQVREPEEMVIKGPQKKVGTDADGKDILVDTYLPNPKIQSEYVPDLQLVLDAMASLITIVRELVRAIPEAMKANNAEIKGREGTVDNLNHMLKKERKALHGLGSKGHDKQRSQLQDDIAKHESALQEENSMISNLKDDKKSYNEAWIDAGFSFREAQIAKDQLQDEKNAAWQIASDDAASQTADALESGLEQGGSGSGSGSSGSGGITYGQQAQIADAQKASVLQQFGGNFAALGANLGAAGAAVAGVGQNMRQSAAALLGPGTGGGLGGTAAGGSSPAALNAGVADLRAAGGAVQSSGAAAAAVSGGAAQASTVTAGGGSVDNSQVKNVQVINNFQAPPPDPHTWAQGTEFELGAIG